MINCISNAVLTCLTILKAKDVPQIHTSIKVSKRLFERFYIAIHSCTNLPSQNRTESFLGAFLSHLLKAVQIACESWLDL
jgi:hypothetical protein